MSSMKQPNHSFSPEEKPATTKEQSNQLASMGFFGFWGSRKELGDSATYSRELRNKAQYRPQ